MTTLRVGVIGLGNRWQRRYLPALLGLHPRFDIRAVCDPVLDRATAEARRLGCAAAGGPVELLHRDDLDAILLLEPGWWRLWPLQFACRFGKPVYCAAPLSCDDSRAEEIRQDVQASGLPVMVEMRPGATPALGGLRELLGADLGSPRLVVCRVRSRRTRSPQSPLEAIGLGLIDACLNLVGGEPSAVQAHELPEAGLASILFEWSDDRAVQVLGLRAARGSGRVRFEVVAERGHGEAYLPRRIGWDAGAGRYVVNLPRSQRVEQDLLAEFHQAVVEKRAPQPGIDQAFRALYWSRLARRSGAEGRRLEAERAADAEGTKKALS